MAHTIFDSGGEAALAISKNDLIPLISAPHLKWPCYSNLHVIVLFIYRYITQWQQSGESRLASSGSGYPCIYKHSFSLSSGGWSLQRANERSKAKI